MAATVLRQTLDRVLAVFTVTTTAAHAAKSDDTNAAMLGVVPCDATGAATSQAAPSIGTITSVNDTNASTTLLAANTSRKGATFYNDSTVNLYLAMSDTTASATAFSVIVPPNNLYELPVCAGGVYTGKVVGIWASDASGACRVTELT